VSKAAVAWEVMVFQTGLGHRTGGGAALMRQTHEWRDAAGLYRLKGSCPIACESAWFPSLGPEM
jgi:hypothetical protein